MADKYQKKFYSDQVTDTFVKYYAVAHNLGYSEAIREIIANYCTNEYVTIPVVGKIQGSKIEIKEAL